MSPSMRVRLLLSPDPSTSSARYIPAPARYAQQRTDGPSPTTCRREAQNASICVSKSIPRRTGPVEDAENNGAPEPVKCTRNVISPHPARSTTSGHALPIGRVGYAWRQCTRTKLCNSLSAATIGMALMRSCLRETSNTRFRTSSPASTWLKSSAGQSPAGSMDRPSSEEAAQ